MNIERQPSHLDNISKLPPTKCKLESNILQPVLLAAELGLPKGTASQTFP